MSHMESTMPTRTPIGLAEIVEIFGGLDAPNFEARHIEPFTLPYPLYYDGNKLLRARSNHLLVDNFVKAFQTLLEQKLDHYVQNYGGIFTQHPIRGQPSHPSTHSSGIAVDLEPQEYPLGSSKRFPQEVVDVFTSCGFFYGGDFNGRKDPMHFQFATNY
jgi:hypothetical protein